MITSKHLTRIVSVMVCICLIASGFIVYAASNFDSVRIPEYEKRLFGDKIITLDIQVAQQAWQALLDNAREKEWIPADLIINGERFEAVGVRTKGNSSLSSARENRYSLQFRFDKYVKGQTYYGLDSLCVNNMMGDYTLMKDYISYEIMNFIEVDTPLKNYASISVNGAAYGFGLALERYEKAFLDRVYNTSAGELYNIKVAMGMRGEFEGDWEDMVNGFPGRQQSDQRGSDSTAQPNFSQGGRPGFSEDWSSSFFQEEFTDFPQDGFPGNTQGTRPGFSENGSSAYPETRVPNIPQRDFTDNPQGGFPNFIEGEPPDFDQGGRPGFSERGMGIGGFGGGRGGGSLVYTSDDPSDYSNIFDNAVFNPTDKDMARVITAIENLNAGNNLEKYLDVDRTLRYFAAHTVVVNLDSYTTNMAQNYYIYERDGKLSILPWDYGLAFGGFQAGNASSVVNFPIDTPVSGVSMDERPLLNVLLEIDEYRERYHEYLSQIIEGYFESGLFEATINSIDMKINAYIRSDNSPYVTYEQYKTSLLEFQKLGQLRAESIKGQLDGSIPSTSSEQSADSSALIDASDVNLMALGSMIGGEPRESNRRFP